jgi:hypothetical protein
MMFEIGSRSSVDKRSFPDSSESSEGHSQKKRARVSCRKETLQNLLEIASNLATISKIDSEAGVGNTLQKTPRPNTPLGNFEGLPSIISALTPIQLELTEENLELHQAFISNECTLSDQIKVAAMQLRHYTNKRLAEQASIPTHSAT